MNIKVIYHRGDLDGLSSAAILRYKYPKATLIGAEYGDDPDFFIAQVTKDDHVIMTDYSLPFPKMLELRDKSGNFTWIDHHISAIIEWEQNGKPFDAYVGGPKNLVAACVLTWQWCFPDLAVPSMVDMLSRYDVWRLDPRIIELQYGARFYLDSLDSPHWSKMLNNYFTDIQEFCRIGRTLIDWEERNNKRLVSETMMRISFEGLRACIINTPSKGSQVFKSVNPNSYDVLIVYGRMNHGKFKYSIYTENPSIDVSLLAKKYGGGGHKAAAGWVSTELPENLVPLA